MLIAQGLMALSARNDLHASLGIYLEFKIPVIISQRLSRVLRSQAHDGSWGNGAHEITAYCVLMLIALATNPLAGLSGEILSAIVSARAYLNASQGRWKAEPIWIEKVRYSSQLLTSVYCTVHYLHLYLPL
jgi:hypothetical protein